MPTEPQSGIKPEGPFKVQGQRADKLRDSSIPPSAERAEAVKSQRPDESFEFVPPPSGMMEDTRKRPLVEVTPGEDKPPLDVDEFWKHVDSELAENKSNEATSK